MKKIAQWPAWAVHTVKNPNLTHFIIYGMMLGLGCGLFLGEYAERLKIIGDIYIGLLQMTVLPYIVFSLIANIGRLSFFQAQLLAKRGLLLLLLLWAIGLVTVFCMALALPAFEGGAFFSTLLIEPPYSIDVLDLFIPSNPFRSLASNSVPAVVLFSLLFGIACIGYQQRTDLLNLFEHAAQVLLRVNHLIIKLTPIGVFGVTASASGTLTLGEFERVQAYIFMLFGSTLLITLWILPTLISCCTPFSYRRILQASQDALLTTFVVGSTFVVIPLLIDAVDRLFRHHVSPASAHARIPDLALPLAYPFPDMGKVLNLFFILFAAWFYGRPLDWADYPVLFITGVFLSFGKLVTAIPFLLEMFQIPGDIFQLFIAVGELCRRFADVVGSMGLMTFTILTTASITQVLKLQWWRLFHVGIISLALMAVTVFGIRQYLELALKDVRPNDNLILQMHLRKSGIETRVLNTSVPNPVPLKSGQGLLDRIRERRLIRVGFNSDSLPYSFFNASDELVGFDIDLIHELAEDLGVGIEFVPYDSGYLLQELEADHFDIALSGITANVSLLASTRVIYTTPYLEANLALVVPDHLRKAFSSEKSIRALGPIRVGVRKDSYLKKRIEEHFPNLQVDELDTEAEFFAIESFRQEALVTTAEGGSAWTLLYPGYTVVNPLEHKEGAPLVFAVAGHDFQLEKYLDTWIAIKQMDGSITQLYDYWILGKLPRDSRPRWSVIRNVLHWVE
ncbi:MAG: cation:dicarboxylate symporter family transporter [Gammaproteobacteria bacterium]